MEKILSIVGMFVFVGGAYLLSKNKKEINWTSVGLAFFAQIILALLLIKTPLWKGVQLMSAGFAWIISQSSEGINFVFGGVSDGFVFFINALLPIVFISALMGLLFHFNIIQKFIAVFGTFIAKILRVDTLVAVNGVSNMFLGQNESLFVTKSYLASASDNVIYATLVAGMSSISVSVIGLYTGFGASLDWIIISIPLTLFSSIIFTQIMMPTHYSEEAIVIEDDKGVNFIETMMNYGMSGFKGVVGISVALMVFISFVYLINNALGLIMNGVTLESILGVVFYPFALIMGVPSEEIANVSQMLATKLVLNEAVAFGMPQFNMLSENTKAMVTVALCGFAGFGSIGSLIGGYSGIAPKRVGTVAKLGFNALITATFVNLLTAAVVGLML